MMKKEDEGEGEEEEEDSRGGAVRRVQEYANSVHNHQEAPSVGNENRKLRSQKRKA
eukprot:CAMPEP_0198215340 /NCGR_PEP_ID=MMETSP1445-20131203/49150_1 /TAXON_ID=36898 /ORGANISM="Pyramimonas sp., Strain CCMP2087" /LENGTH=55 /DNA_ID=CAMNT_0043891023 /DNA_START=63 /DNA_END=230 /DNA_ORIENTATION=+